MNRFGHYQLAHRLPRFQYSLRGLLALTTLVAVVLGLAKWNHAVGDLAAVTIFGTWATALAISAHRHRLAYYLAALTCGVIWYLALVLPISLSGAVLAAGMYKGPWYFFSLKMALCCCLPSLLAAAILRAKILDSPEFSLGSLVALVYLTSILSFTAFNLSESIAHPYEGGYGLMTVLMVGPFVVTLSFYTFFPAGLFVQALLRGVDQMTCELARIEQSILEAVGILQVFDAGPIQCEEIAKRIGESRKTAAAFLDRMCNSGTLTWTEQDGYRVARGRPTRARRRG